MTTVVMNNLRKSALAAELLPDEVYHVQVYCRGDRIICDCCIRHIADFLDRCRESIGSCGPVADGQTWLGVEHESGACLTSLAGA